MVQERHIRLFHIIVTVQFAVSASLVMFWSLWQTNLSWWQVFSLTSQGFVVVILAVLIYGFAVFSGAVGARTEGEYPLSGSMYYRVFYLVVPVFAGVTSGIDYLVNEGLLEGLRGWALGTVVSASVVWIFIDSIVGIAETSLPANRVLRRSRIAAEKERVERERRERDQLLAQLRAERAARLAALAPLVEKNAAALASALLESSDDPRQGSDAGAWIGFQTWQAGGMEALAELYAAAQRECARRGKPELVTRLDYWWDGIGQWRQGNLEGTSLVHAA